jgi:Predicted membrane protein
VRPTASVQELDELYGRPSASPADTGRMSYNDTIMKTLISFGILLVGAVVGWMVPFLALPAAIAGFVLALVNIFKKNPSPGLILTYSAVQGVFVGGISFHL